MNKNNRFAAALLVALTLVPAGAALAAKPIQICDDGAWPPYTFVDPKNPQAVVGASAELMVEILKRANYQATIVVMPWKRCLEEVESGETALLLNATYSDERAAKYLMSKPYYSLTSGLFHLKSKYPSPPKIRTVAEMKKYRYCGLLGYNYTMYDLPESQLDAGARDEPGRFRKLQLDHCDFVLGDVELLKSFAALGQIDLAGVSHIPIPGAKPKEFHVLVSKKHADGTQLLKLINDGFSALKADGTRTKIFKKYGL
jgi:polar amino acid transport system substrate-binding protein